MLTPLLLETPESWPGELLAVLESYEDLFAAWERGTTTNCAKAYDRAIYDVADHLRLYSILGWHCSRLTDHEIDQILSGGIQLPNAETLHRRIDECVTAEFLTLDIAAALKAKNQAQESSRAGRFHFCFSHPKLFRESGISRFFRHWGGEALYNFHEDNPVTSMALRAIGTPCVVATDVPIASLKDESRLVCNVVRRFLAHGGHRVKGTLECSACIDQELAREAIRAVFRFPTEEFLALTGCAEWNKKVS